MSGQDNIDYNSHVKEGYRRRIYDFVESVVKTPVAKRTVAYLDAAAAGETLHLIKIRGYLAANLQCVNRATKVIAQLKRSLRKGKTRFPIIVEGDFAKVLQDTKPVDVVNFDGMGTVSFKLLREIENLVPLVKAGGVLAVNQLAARGLSLEAEDKVWFVLEAVRASGRPILRHDVYRYKTPYVGKDGKGHAHGMMSIAMQLGANR